MGRARRRSKAAWSVALAPGHLYAGVEPAGLFPVSDGGESFAPVQGLRDHPTRPRIAQLQGRRRSDPPFDCARSRRPAARSGSRSRPRPCSTAATAARPGRRATRGRAPTSLPENQRYPVCPVCALHVGQGAGARRSALSTKTTAACTVATTVGGPGSASKRVCRGPLGFPRTAPSARSRRRCFSFRSMARSRAGLRPKAGLRCVCFLTEAPHELGWSEGLPQSACCTKRSRLRYAFGAHVFSAPAPALSEGKNWTRIAENRPAISSVETLVIDA